MSAFLALLSAAQLCFSPRVRETSFWKGQGRDSKAVSRTLSCQPTAHRASKACGETQRPRSGKGCLHTWVGGVERQGVEAQKPDSPQDRNEEERATVQVPEQLPGPPPPRWQRRSPGDPSPARARSSLSGSEQAQFTTITSEVRRNQAPTPVCNVLCQGEYPMQ